VLLPRFFAIPSFVQVLDLGQEPLAETLLGQVENFSQLEALSRLAPVGQKDRLAFPHTSKRVSGLCRLTQSTHSSKSRRSENSAAGVRRRSEAATALRLCTRPF